MSLWSAPGGPDPRLEHLRHLRVSYRARPLEFDDLPPAPGAAFAQWFAEAEGAGIIEPNAMSLACVDPEGVPSLRTVLLKDASDTGFSFFTNYESRKGRQLRAGGRAALLFTWLPLYRQVEVTGDVRRLPDRVSDEYFATRPRDSQLAAWASPQSTPIDSRAVLRERWAAFQQRFRDRDVPRPPHWGGFEVAPFRVEFWQGQPSRMHDRIEYRSLAGVPARLDDGTAWSRRRLAP